MDTMGLHRQIQQLKTTVQTGSYDFDEMAMELFRIQSSHNPVYRRYLDLLRIEPDFLTSLDQVPFLPIQLFKYQNIRTGYWETNIWFESSGTTGQQPSRHLIEDLDFYLANCTRGFTRQWGSPQDWCFLALLPGYLERRHSSLVAMVSHFIERSQQAGSGFYLYDHQKLFNQLLHCKANHTPTILFGVSFALIDFLEQHPLDFPELHIIETGGMKGRKEEMTKESLHGIIRQRTSAHIHSEYGMTELLSQSYSRDGLFFHDTPTLRFRIFEREDPLVQERKLNRAGRVGIIDLANVATCSFLLTEDLGRFNGQGYTIDGRLDQSEWRGCNLLVQDL